MARGPEAAIEGLRTIRGESNLPPQTKLSAIIQSPDAGLRARPNRSSRTTNDHNACKGRVAEAEQALSRVEAGDTDTYGVVGPAGPPGGS